MTPGSLSGRELYLRLLGHVRPYSKIFFGAIVCMVVAAATEPIFPALMKGLIDSSFGKGERTLFGFALQWIPLFIVFLFVARGIASFLSDYAMSWIGNRVVLDLRNAMFAKLLLLPARYFDDHATGNLVSKLTFDVAQVANAATRSVTILVKDSLVIFGLIAYLLYLNWQLTAITFFVVPFAAYIVRKVSHRLRLMSRGAQKAMGQVTQVAEETIDCQRVVKLFGGQEYEARRFHEAANASRRYVVKQAIAAAAGVPLVETIAAIALAIIIFLAIQQAQGDQTTVGGFVSFIVALVMVLTPLKRLAGINDALQRGLAAAESVFALVDETPEQDRGTIDIGRAQGELRFENVNLSYGGDAAPALREVSFHVRPGETIALVGASGSGKTSLVNLIPRFYHASSGRILVDGHDVEAITLKSLRANIALVSQDVVLFNDTVAANIAYGPLAAAPEREVLAAAEAAHAMEFIQRMPQGMQTQIGENGVKLSGGQRQRLAIARALLKNAPILILDEATSALDTEAEKLVQAALETLMRGRTTIVIAHRLSTIEHADRIFVMKDGAIIETGSHAELLRQGGAYASLHRSQFSEASFAMLGAPAAAR